MPTTTSSSRPAPSQGKKRVLFIEPGKPDPSKLHQLFQDTAKWDIAYVDRNTDQFKPDFIGHLQDLSAIPDDYADALWFIQKLQTVRLEKLPEVLATFKRILRPNGQVVTVCPDAFLAAEHIYEYRIMEPLKIGEISRTVQDVFYGADEPFHNCFTAGSLGKAFLHAGFRNIQISRQSFNLWMAATYEPASVTKDSEKIRINDHHQAYDGQKDDLSAPPTQWSPLNLNQAA